MLVEGAYQDLPVLQAVISTVFTQFEAIFATLGIELYDQDIAP